MTQTFNEYCMDFLGKRVFRITRHNGLTRKKEVYRFILYWNNISYNDVYLSDKYLIENR